MKKLLKKIRKKIWQIELHLTAFRKKLSFSKREKEFKGLIMFHIGRSGSTLLGDLLQQHKNIYWIGEIFDHITDQTIKKGKEQKPETFYETLQELMEKVPKNKICGIEIKFYNLQNYQISIQDFLKQSQKMGFQHYIVLERKNYLKKIISSLVARKTLEWHLPPKIKATPSKIRIKTERIKIDNSAQSLKDHLIKYKKSFQQAKQALKEQNNLSLTYENDLLQNPQIAVEKVIKFLELESFTPKIRYSKTTPFPVKLILLNFEEIQKYLAETEFEWMLNE